MFNLMVGLRRVWELHFAELDQEQFSWGLALFVDYIADAEFGGYEVLVNGAD